MAKKSTRRHDPDLEDEAYDDDPPPRKKGSGRAEKPSKTSSTGKRKSADAGSSRERNGASSVSRKGGLKDSGKRSAASGRRGGSSDDGEMNSSARRRRAAPGPKKQDNTLVIGISVVSITLLLVIGIFVINSRGPTGSHVDQVKEFDDYKRLDQEAMAAFREFNRAEKAGEAGLARQKSTEAHQKWTAAVDILNKILDYHRDPSTGNVKAEYEGYEEELSRIAQHLVDLEKRSTVR
ncbi:MAG: hypothetical protein M9894_07380 [Planctomycetes bacterium]|nr:hypothetical protein [Planctomycetota bacterium]